VLSLQTEDLPTEALFVMIDRILAEIQETVGSRKRSTLFILRELYALESGFSTVYCLLSTVS
jgi:hypothetical protein